MKKEKRIPTILGLFLLVGTIYLTTRLLNTPKSTSIKASQSCDPVNPQITNKTDTSTTISFTTTNNCHSTLNVSGFIYENLKPKGKVHYFEVDNLESNKNYQFFIISDGKKYESGDYIFKTAQKPNKNIPASNLAWGKIFTPESNPATEAIVYLNIPGASPLSAIVTSSGHWSVSLAVSFNEGLTDWFTTPPNIEEDIVVIAPDYPSTQIVSSTSWNNPVPDIILGQNNFSSPVGVDVEIPTTANVSSLVDLPNTPSQDQTLTVISPKTNESVNSLRPDILGTASPNTKIKIKIESPIVYADEIIVSSNSQWKWSPKKDLTPGEQVISVTDENSNKISHKFTILAPEGSLPSYTASKSSTITNTPTPNPTLAPTKTPTPTPTTIITATPTQKITPTSIPATQPSTASGVPKTGTSTPTVIFILLSFISLMTGLIYSKKS